MGLRLIIREAARSFARQVSACEALEELLQAGETVATDAGLSTNRTNRRPAARH
jgi:hypothetical protein